APRRPALRVPSRRRERPRRRGRAFARARETPPRPPGGRSARPSGGRRLRGVLETEAHPWVLRTAARELPAVRPKLRDHRPFVLARHAGQQEPAPARGPGPEP